jgi:predicted MPP superfamily phosphohydrolase
MTTTYFDPTATHDQAHDVRRWEYLSHKLNKGSNGCLHVLVAPRRAGKTWALRALEAGTGGHYLDLRAGTEDDWYEENIGSSTILLDEAGRLILSEPHAFLRRCRQHKTQGRTVMVAISPREYAALRAADPSERFLSAKDRHFLNPLTAEEAHRLARGLGWAEELIPAFPEGWSRSAFLLTCALFAAEQAPELRLDKARLTKRAIEIANDNDYVRSVVYEGLSSAQRSTLRWFSGQGSAKDPSEAAVLQSCGLVPPGSTRAIADPVLCDHFRPALLVHHVSDVHVGPKSARVVDQKDHSGLGDVLAKGGGQDWIRDEYLEHVKNQAKPHVIALSGDLVEHGGNDKQLEEAAGWLASIQAAANTQNHPDLRDSDPRVIMVGGNHDVDWTATTLEQPLTRRHEPFSRRFESYPHPELHKPHGDRRAPFVHYRDCRVSFLLLGSAEFGGQVGHEKQSAADGNQWVDQLLKLLQASIDDAARERLARVLTELGVDIQADGEKLLVHRVDPGLVAQKSLERARADQGNTEPLRIALLHHPLTPLPAAPEIAQYAGLTNAGQVKSALFAMEVQLALHGHQHRGFYSEERWPSASKGPLRILAAPSLASIERDESNGYNELRIFREGDALVAVEIRTVRFQGAQWTTSDTARFLIGGSRADEWNVDVAKEA